MALTLIDDSELLELAAPRARDVFPVMRRASAFTPLVVLLAILPGVLAIDSHLLSESDAMWGLRSLDVLTSPWGGGLIDTSLNSSVDEARWQPPLGSWLTALSLWLFGTEYEFSLIAVSFLAAAALFLTMYGLVRTSAGPRLAFWTVLLMAGNGTLIRLFHQPANQPLAILLAVCTIWAYLSHLSARSSIVSVTLLLGGLALGGCLLSGGPMALIVVAMLLIYVLGFRGESVQAKRSQGAGKRRVWVGWKPLQSLLVLGVTAFAVGGWWVLMMASRHQSEFWLGWLGATGAAGEPLVRGIPLAVLLSDRVLSLFGVWFAVVIVGIVRAGYGTYATSDEDRGRSLLLMMAWIGCAALPWVSLLRNPRAAHYATENWQQFLLLPAMVAAALVIDEMDRRQLSVPASITLLVGSIAGGLVWVMQSPAILYDQIAVAWLVVVAGLAATCWWLVRTHHNRELAARVGVGGLIVAGVVVHAAAGFASLGRDDPDSRALEHFRNELSAGSTDAGCVLIAESNPPLRLQYVLRAHCADRTLTRVAHWDAALSHIIAERNRGRQRTIVVEWSPRETRPTSIPIAGLRVRSITSMHYFERFQLRAYAVSFARR